MQEIDGLIIAAMDEEMDEIVHLLDQVEVVAHSTRVVMGRVDSKRVLVVKSGVGKINAALTATYFMQTYHPRFVINVGSAGGLLHDQHVGDLVIGTKVLSHDLDIGPETHHDPRFQYQADQRLIDCVDAVLQSMKKQHYIGLIVSGDQFVTHDSYAYKRIKDLYPDAICVEMEATAVGAACTYFNIPFVIIRALSDVPFYKDNELSFKAFLSHAAKESALICIETIKTVNHSLLG